MKHILVAFFFFIIPFWLFANEEIQVNIGSSDIEIWEILNLEIVFDPGVSQGDIEISIPGIESFSVFGQSRSQQTQIINGQAATVMSYTLSVTAQEEWIYTLWPVNIQLWNELISDDESIEVRVWWSKNINSSQSAPLGNQVNSVDTRQEEDVPIEMPEIRWTRWYEIPLWMYILACILVLLGFYFALRYYFQNMVSKTPDKPSLDISTVWEKLHVYFKTLEADEDIKSEEYFRRFNMWMREVFSQEWFQDMPTATLKELQKKPWFQEHKLFHIFKETYKYEYSTSKLPEDDLKNYFQKVYNYLDSKWK